MIKLIIAHTLALSLFSSLAFAEGGADRIAERNEARIQEAVAVEDIAKDESQSKTKADAVVHTESSS